jgi:hypothetical protein
MIINFQKIGLSSINNQIKFIFNRILPMILFFTFMHFVLGLRLNTKKENWINYMNVPFGEIDTGSDCPVGYYIRPQYRKPYRYPYGIEQSYPIKHIAPIML